MLIKPAYLAGVFVSTLIVSCQVQASQANQTATLGSVISGAKEVSHTKQALFFATIKQNRVEKRSIVPRIIRLSGVLLGVPYVDGASGEGKKGLFDRDPRFRFDQLDCTTYVETVLAGALSKTPDDFLATLTKIRYKAAKVSFVHRNHFPSLDWFANNQARLTDITRQIGGAQTQQARAEIDKKSWYQNMTMRRLQSIHESPAQMKALLDQLHHAGDAFKPQLATLDYIPLTAIFMGSQGQQNATSPAKINTALLKKIPTGSIISMVRPNWPLKKWIGTNMNVSHQSFLIRKQGVLYLRHASQIKKKVIDVRFVDYLAHYRHSATLKGFNVQSVKSDF